ncbi:MAG TPA: dolichyl-phosphate beta-glucosyltransferase [Thermomicrobiales bacterium]|nr:dolichyl-phosphate beta-glucosyltransferase [Thermomicrobiales bacterium]
MRVDNQTASDNGTVDLPPVSIVVPVYNEKTRISDSLERIWAWFNETEPGAEIIFVDDGSTDGTTAIARAFEDTHPGVRVLAEKHRGKAAAVISGLEAARGAIVGFMDVDLATPLETWLACRDAIQAGAGVAIGSREGAGASRVGEPAYRHIMGRIFNGFVRFLLLPGIHDSQCGFKFFSRVALDDILPRQRLYRNAEELSIPRVTAFDVELLFIARQQGYEIVSIPVTWQYGDHSKVNPVTDTLQNMRDILTVRINGWRGLYR